MAKKMPFTGLPKEMKEYFGPEWLLDEVSMPIHSGLHKWDESQEISKFMEEAREHGLEEEVKDLGFVGGETEAQSEKYLSLAMTKIAEKVAEKKLEEVT